MKETQITMLPEGDVLASVNELESQVQELRNSLTTDRMDMSFGEIMNMYEQGEIIISPEFQRLFRWTIEQKTKFIESILLGIPIPPIFVAEDNDGRWELVDGLQRISTVLSFFGILRTDNPEINKWSLISGDLLDTLDGFNIDNLPNKYRLNIKRSVCRIEIIKWDSQWDMRYELFSRLNTGGAALTDQEIRNCIFRSGLKNLYAFIDEAVGNEMFTNLTALTARQKLELYDQELIVRYMCLVDSWEMVNASISMYMTNYLKEKLDKGEDISEEVPDKFYRVLRLLQPIGKSVFRFDNSKICSSSLYDAVMIGLSENLDFYEAHPDKVGAVIDQLKIDTQFRKNSGVASSSKNRAKRRIKRALELFGESAYE